MKAKINESNIILNNEKKLLDTSSKLLFKTLDIELNICNETFEDYSSNRLKYFNEVIIIKKEVDGSISNLYYYSEAETKTKEIEFRDLNIILEEFSKEPLTNDIYWFIKDDTDFTGKEYRFNLVIKSKIKSKDYNTFILLNNSEMPLYEIEEKFPKAWRNMNSTNIKISAIVRGYLEHSLIN